jgi:hypothetical protein
MKKLLVAAAMAAAFLVPTASASALTPLGQLAGNGFYTPGICAQQSPPMTLGIIGHWTCNLTTGRWVWTIR